MVALSGGPDSVALLHILRELEAQGDLVVAGAAHFNHGLRGEASDGDEAFCRDLTASLGVPLETGACEVRALALREKRSIEDAARRVRYAFLAEAAARLGADAVAIGHSRDDQAETFLLRLIRGAGTRGLGAIRPKAGLFVRPLIDISRDALRQYAADGGLTFRDDASNADVAVPRNRVRHELLPYLEREFSPGIVEVLAREAALARDDDDRLEAEAIDLAASVVLTDIDPATGRPVPGTVQVEVQALGSLHPALASRVARRALQYGAGERFVGFEHVHRFLDFVRSGEPGSAISLPGQQARHLGGIVRLGPEPPRTARHSGAGENQFRIPLSIPGEVLLRPQQMVLSVREWSEGSEGSEGSGRSGDLQAFVRGAAGPLAVRSRKPGDRFQPPGLGGRSKKLQDYLVDRKVPRADRDFLPLVVDSDDRIVWVVGHGVAEGFRAPAPSPGVILLKARRLGGEV
ncbi:MAG: tRNA lysidine(34) synthetase TilS [Vicinamibacterales bacterium]